MAEPLAHLRPLRFQFQALDRVSLAEFPGHTIRGALGEALRRVGCRRRCPGPGNVPGAEVCPWRAACAYGRIFDPLAHSGPSGFYHPPRPFALRVHQLAGREIQRDASFSIGLHWFDVRNEALLVNLIHAMACAGRAGWNGARARLLAVEQLNAAREPLALLYGAAGFARTLSPALALSASTPLGPVRRLKLEFLTPLLLLQDQQRARAPLFGPLLARIRDRLSTLALFYGQQPLEMDFKGLAERAATVRLTVDRTEWLHQERRSRRSGEPQPLGGFVGEACYEGDLGPFVPFLRAAWWTGVGKNTAWGQGIVRTVL